MKKQLSNEIPFQGSESNEILNDNNESDQESKLSIQNKVNDDTKDDNNVDNIQNINDYDPISNIEINEILFDNIENKCEIEMIETNDDSTLL